MIELEKFRNEIKAFSISSISCNGILIKNHQNSLIQSSLLSKSITHLREAQKQNLTYCLGEWAKVSLFLTFIKSLKEPCDLELLEFFELSRNPKCFNVSSSLERIKGSIGIIHDQFLSILWIMIITIDSKLLLFKVNINIKSFTQKIKKLHELCSQNTESLRNTTEISKDTCKKSDWWKLRKSLDSELLLLCSELNDEMFSYLSVRFNYYITILKFNVYLGNYNSK